LRAGTPLAAVLLVSVRVIVIPADKLRINSAVPKQLSVSEK